MAHKLCPLCGLYRKALGSHKGSGTCREQQVKNQMRERGLFPLPTLQYAKLLKWADLPYERAPALARRGRTNHKAWNAHLRRRLLNPTPDYAGGLYKGLGDMLFVEEWVVMLLKHRDIPNPSSRRKEHLKPLVGLLRGIQERDDEFKKAMMATQALGGDGALNVLLVAEGLWDHGI